jgi:hypothetical protein
VPLDVRCATNNDRILAVLQLVEMGHEQTFRPGPTLAAVRRDARPKAVNQD